MIPSQNLDESGGLTFKTEEQWDMGTCQRSEMGVGVEREHGAFEELKENDKVAGLSERKASG